MSARTGGALPRTPPKGRRPFGIPVSVMVSCVLFCGSPVTARAGTVEVEAERAETLATRERLLREEGRLAAELAGVKARVDDLSASAAQTAATYEATRRERETLAAELAELRKFFLENRVKIRKRVCAIYKKEDLARLGSGLSVADPLAFADHLQFSLKVLAKDHAFLSDLSTKLRVSREKTAALADREAKEKDYAERVRAERLSVERESARLARLLSDLHNSGRALQMKLDEYRAAVKTVNGEVATIRADPTPAAELSSPYSAGQPDPAEPDLPVVKPPRRPPEPEAVPTPKAPDAPAAPVDFAWPLPDRKREVLSFFGKQTDPVFNIEFSNAGVDIRGDQGEKVCAAAAGVVRYRGQMKGLGSVIMVEHSPAFISLYSMLGGIEVGIGAKVKAGDPVGTIGPPDHPGKSPYLHFEIRRNGESVDPMEFF